MSHGVVSVHTSDDLPCIETFSHMNASSFAGDVSTHKISNA